MTEQARFIRELVEMIVRALVEDQSSVDVQAMPGSHSCLIEVRVAKKDIGAVVGKGGAHASAIRTILAGASGKDHRRYVLEILE